MKAPQDRSIENAGTASENNKPQLKVDTTAAELSKKNDDDDDAPLTPRTEASTPSTVSTPPYLRSESDMRSPGQAKTPKQNEEEATPAVVPDFITQTDKYGRATTPRSQDAIQNARMQHPAGPKPHLHVDKHGQLTEDEDSSHVSEDACETLLDSLRLMCCCLVPDESNNAKQQQQQDRQLQENGSRVMVKPQDDRVKLLGKHHPDDFGKKCLVLDLDETLVHSSFRAVPGADFVIPVQIEDVVHFVYVMKRPGVDEFLIEMAKHYEVVVYTASLNKYADPLLDLLDPERVIRSRLFRESCVYFEGSYVKDLSLLDRDLSQVIIVDNSPTSYIFHPENAIDCTSFIDDPKDLELKQIGDFLSGIKDLSDVRHTCNRWRDWPNVNLSSREEMKDKKR